MVCTGCFLVRSAAIIGGVVVVREGTERFVDEARASQHKCFEMM